jgi:hypothetical protein
MKENKELAEDFGKIVTPLLDTEAGRKVVAEKVLEYVTNQIEQQDLSELILDKKTVGVGQTYEWIHRGKLKAYWHEPGSYAPRTAMTQKTFRIPTKMISAHPEYLIKQLKSGRYGTIADQVSAAREAIMGEINAMVFNTIIGAVPSTAPNYAAVATGTTGVASFKTALDNAIRWCKDRPGGAKAIVGRGATLDYIMDFSNSNNNVFSDGVVDQIMRTGVLGVYRGVPVIGLSQYEDAFGKPTIPADEILVIGNNVGKVIFEDEAGQANEIDIDTLIWHMHIWMNVGAGVLFPENISRIHLT